MRLRSSAHVARGCCNREVAFGALLRLPIQSLAPETVAMAAKTRKTRKRTMATFKEEPLAGRDQGG